MYINAASVISPQQVFRQEHALGNMKELSGNRFTCIEPDYGQLIEPKLIRRMSRLIRMGVATALDTLQQAGINDPSAILVGTAYGCLEDTGIFLKRLVENGEEMLTPTAFIQSTHNTVGAQVALLLKCHAYNNTYVQRGHSFESALLDASLLLKENEDARVLLGAADETTNESFMLLERFGLFRNAASGEGACFFLMESKPAAGTIAKFCGLRTLFKPDLPDLQAAINELLDVNEMDTNSIDLLLTGNTGNADIFYPMVEMAIFSAVPRICFKNYCGEYPTATAFACWLAAKILQVEKPVTLVPGETGIPTRILVYNNDDAGYHTLMLLSAC